MLKKMNGLQKLWVSSNQLSSLPINLHQLEEIQEIVLSGNNLTSFDYTLDQFPNLKDLYIIENQLSKSEIKKLKNDFGEIYHYEQK